MNCELRYAAMTQTATIIFGLKMGKKLVLTAAATATILQKHTPITYFIHELVTLHMCASAFERICIRGFRNWMYHLHLTSLMGRFWNWEISKYIQKITSRGFFLRILLLFLFAAVAVSIVNVVHSFLTFSLARTSVSWHQNHSNARWNDHGLAKNYRPIVIIN